MQRAMHFVGDSPLSRCCLPAYTSAKRPTPQLQYIAVTLLESRKVAEVLSYLPQGVDIQQLAHLSGQTLEAAGRSRSKVRAAQSSEQEG